MDRERFIQGVVYVALNAVGLAFPLVSREFGIFTP